MSTNHRLEPCQAWCKTRGTELKLEKLHYHKADKGDNQALYKKSRVHHENLGASLSLNWRDMYLTDGPLGG